MIILYAVSQRTSGTNKSDHELIYDFVLLYMIRLFILMVLDGFEVLIYEISTNFTELDRKHHLMIMRISHKKEIKC